MTTPKAPPPVRMLDERAAADFLDISIKTLQGWRQRRIGPRYFKLGNRVKYLPKDLNEYLATCAVEPRSGPQAQGN